MMAINGMKSIVTTTARIWMDRIFLIYLKYHMQVKVDMNLITGISIFSYIRTFPYGGKWRIGLLADSLRIESQSLLRENGGSDNCHEL
jgi:hypothetical protein